MVEIIQNENVSKKLKELKYGLQVTYQLDYE